MSTTDIRKANMDEMLSLSIQNPFCYYLNTMYVQAVSKQGIILKISQFTFNISSVSTHKRNATSHNNKNWKHAISFKFLLLPTLNLWMTQKYSQKPRTGSSSLIQARDWKMPCELPHRALPAHPHPAIPTRGLSAGAGKVLSHSVQVHGCK